jgi:triosephosphate isomerase
MQLVIAYEPIWAIGKSAAEAITPADLTEMVLYIRKVLAEYLPGKGSGKIRILYGGSVEPSNIRALAAASGVDGFLVGHASTDAQSLGALVKAVT